MPRHYLNQCWNIVNLTLGDKLKSNINQNLNIFTKKHCKVLFGKWQPFCLGLSVLNQGLGQSNFCSFWLLVVGVLPENIKMPSYQYKKSHCGDKMILWSSYVHNGFLIWVRWHLYIKSGPLNNLWPFWALTINMWGPSYLSFTWSTSLLLMPWLLASLGHQQQWYWLYRICRSCSYLRKDFKYLCHIKVG